MDNTFSDGVFIEAEMTMRPVPPGTKSRRSLAQQQEQQKNAPPPESPPPEQPPEEATGTESK